nr:MBL fold metallo-hydrolase [Francisella frigiditurris]
MMQIKRWFLDNSLRNYQYVIYDDVNAIVVDPLRADIYSDFLNSKKLQLKAILVTHKHGDHIAGVNKLLEEFPSAKVYAFEENDRFKPDVYVKEGDNLDLGFCKIKVFYTPGHIADHVCYLFDDEKALFCGDTLFNAGVGGVQAATANVKDLYHSISKLVKLDRDIRLYPAHDYWEGNLAFALSILPNDEAFLHYKETVVPLVADHKPIVTLSEESKFNIFIRSLSDNKLSDALPNYKLGQEMFIKLRDLKNNF